MARTLAYEAIDINNFNNIRERSTFPSKISSKSLSISFTTSFIPYHEKIEINNDLPDEKFTEPVDSFQLSYKNNSVMILILRVGYKNNSYIRETQENSIEFLVQSSLSYILLLMVCAYYCAPYPNDHVYDMRPTCVVHVV